MASDHQLAIARPLGSSSTNLSKATRQVVPPFLQKLYEMVSDQTSDELIKWSDQGDSFFVFDQERFAREVLGRWFKHNKFTSFVRQLNMYGFHKIPHLQQGVLKSENETEMWNFEHPNFHRGQPDLLCLIQRKKAPEKGGGGGDDVDDGVGGPGPGSGSGANAAPATLTSGQLIDINSIVNGITAIKRHQTAISADLNELKNSNSLLWQEAIAARERHKKQQDTINRILKFLAGVFGQSANTHRQDSPGNASVMPRKMQRLMIEGAQGKRDKGAALYEMPEDQGARVISQPETPATEIPNFDQFNSVATTNPIPTLPLHQSTADGILPSLHASTDAYAASAPSSVPVKPLSEPTTLVPNARNSLSPVPNQPGSDAAFQAAFSNMLDNSQLQKLMSAIQSQSSFQMPSDVTFGSYPGQDGIPAPYPENTLGLGSADQFSINTDFRPSSSLALPSTLSQTEDGAEYQPFMENSDQLQKSVKDAETIGQDLNGLETSINSLIESLGLDPNALQTTTSGGTTSSGTEGSMMPVGEFQSEPPVDFDFESFLHDYSSAEGAPYTFDDSTFDPSTVDGELLADQSSAFLDEVASNASSASPAQANQPLPPEGLPALNASRKRKSDISGLDDLLAPDGPSPNKVKRKR